MKTDGAQATSRSVRRFVVVGGLNTLLTGAGFVGLSLLIDPWVAYTIVFLLGLSVTTVVTARYVFEGAGIALWQVVAFVACYLSIYVIGYTLVELLVRVPGAPDSLAVAVILVTAPLSFFGGRMIFSDRTNGPPQSEDQNCSPGQGRKR